jgi:multiple sugar transport system substrate-binding protein
MTRSPQYLQTSILLAWLMLSGCTSVSPIPTATSDRSVVSGTTTPSPSPISTSTQAASIGVNGSALHGVSIQVWDSFSGGAADVFASQLALFNSVNEWGIVVNPTSFGDYPSLFDAVNNALGSGSGSPDLVAALPEQAEAWNVSHSVVDLTPYLGDPIWGLGRDAIADFPPVFWSQDNINGVQLGIPAQRSAHFLFYNKTWAHELGFTAPPQTADEFRQQACAANASFRTDANPGNDGYGGWIVDTSWQTTYSWLLAFGGGVADGTSYGFRTDPNLAALQYIKSLFDDHCAWLSTEPTPFDSFAKRSALFVSGDLAEVPMAAESMSRLKNTDEWTLIPFPGTIGRVLVAYGPSYTVLKSTPEKQLAAWLFARWLLSSQNQAQWVESTGLFPLRDSVLPQIGPYRTASPQWEVAVNDLSLVQGVPQLASWRQVRYVLEDGATVIFQMNTPLDQIPSALTDMDSMAQELNK